MNGVAAFNPWLDSELAIEARPCQSGTSGRLRRGSEDRLERPTQGNRIFRCHQGRRTPRQDIGHTVCAEPGDERVPGRPRLENGPNLGIDPPLPLSRASDRMTVSAPPARLGATR